MRFENRRWLVIPTSIIDDIDFNQVHEANADSLRTSIDGTQTFIKYEVVVVENDYVTKYTHQVYHTPRLLLYYYATHRFPDLYT